jgi:hypothetical protein
MRILGKLDSAIAKYLTNQMVFWSEMLRTIVTLPKLPTASRNRPQAGKRSAHFNGQKPFTSLRLFCCHFFRDTKIWTFFTIFSAPGFLFLKFDFMA